VLPKPHHQALAVLAVLAVLEFILGKDYYEICSY